MWNDWASVMAKAEINVEAMISDVQLKKKIG